MRRRLALVTGASLLLLSGCSDCGRASQPSSADAGVSDAASASAPADAAASELANAPVATSVIEGLAQPAALLVSGSHIYFADATAGTIARAPRDGGQLEVLASDQAAPSSLALLGDDIVWLNASKTKWGAAPASASADGKSGVFKCTPSQIPCVVRPVRAGAFATMGVTGKDVVVTESVDDKHLAISRITGPTLTRIAEHEGRPMAMTADATYAYVATFGIKNQAKVLVAALAGRPGDEKTTTELPFRGPGFNALKDAGDQLLGTGVVDRKFGLFRVPKDAPRASLLAHDVAPGAFAVSGEHVFFVSGKDMSLRKVKLSGGKSEVAGRLPPGIAESTAVALSDGFIYVAGKGANNTSGDGGASGVVVRLAVR